MALQNSHGNKGERLVRDEFRKNGYWVHIFDKSSFGAQPFDIIAIKESNVFMVDAKYVDNGKCSFPFNRIEPNQFTSLDYAINFAKINEKGLGFAVIFERDEENIRYVKFTQIMDMLKDNKKSINMSEMDLLKNVL